MSYEVDPAARAEAVDAALAEALITGPDGKAYMRDAKGALMPEHLVRPADKLEDQLVRKMMAYARDLHAQIARFKSHCHGDVAAFMQLLAEEYEANKGGAKGNVTFTSYDGTMKVQVAKALIDECITGWAEGARDELRALVANAFNTDKEGEVSRDAIFRLMRVEIADERWKKAMEAIRDSIRVTGSKSYIRFYQRPSAEANWDGIPIDLAAV